MYIILGATGHIGATLTTILLARKEPVTIVSHDAEKAREWEQRGARAAVVDVHDMAALRQVFRQGKRLFLLNPPAPPSTDTAAEEQRSLQAILAAIQGSGLEFIVAESTYGAQPGEAIGDLGVLYEMEQALRAQPIPAAIIRGAYYMSNWDSALETARKQGELPTFYPPDFQLPMVAPADIAQVAARLLTGPAISSGPHLVEGPARYSSADVAAAFAKALHRPVQAVETPPAQWQPALEEMGYSAPAAASFTAMTRLTLQGEFPAPEAAEHGPTTLQQYVQALVSQAE